MTLRCRSKNSELSFSRFQFHKFSSRQTTIRWGTVGLGLKYFINHFLSKYILICLLLGVRAHAFAMYIIITCFPIQCYFVCTQHVLNFKTQGSVILCTLAMEGQSTSESKWKTTTAWALPPQISNVLHFCKSSQNTVTVQSLDRALAHRYELM